VVFDAAGERLAQHLERARARDGLEGRLARTKRRCVPVAREVERGLRASRHDHAAELRDETRPVAHARDLVGLKAVATGAGDHREPRPVELEHCRGRGERWRAGPIDEQCPAGAEQRTVEVGVEDLA